MPLLLVGALGLLGGALVVKLAVREARRVNAELDAVRAGRANDAPPRQTLRRDPLSGEYRAR